MGRNHTLSPSWLVEMLAGPNFDPSPEGHGFLIGMLWVGNQQYRQLIIQWVKRWNMSDHFPHWFARSERYFRHVQTMFEYNFDQMDQSAMFVCGFENPLIHDDPRLIVQKFIKFEPWTKKKTGPSSVSWCLVVPYRHLQTTNKLPDIGDPKGSRCFTIMVGHGWSYFVMLWYPHISTINIHKWQISLFWWQISHVSGSSSELVLSGHHRPEASGLDSGRQLLLDEFCKTTRHHKTSGSSMAFRSVTSV